MLNERLHFRMDPLPPSRAPLKVDTTVPSPQSRSRLVEAEKIRQEFIKSEKLLIPPSIKKVTLALFAIFCLSFAKVVADTPTSTGTVTSNTSTAASRDAVTSPSSANEHQGVHPGITGTVTVPAGGAGGPEFPPHPSPAH